MKNIDIHFYDGFWSYMIRNKGRGRLSNMWDNINTTILWRNVVSIRTTISRDYTRLGNEE